MHTLITACVHFAGAEYLLALPARLHLQRLACGTMAALLTPHAVRSCSVTALLARMMSSVEKHSDVALQLMLALLRSANLHILSNLCRAMVEANHGAQISSLLVEIIRCIDALHNSHTCLAPCRDAGTKAHHTMLSKASTLEK